MKYVVVFVALFSLNLSAAIQVPADLSGVDLVTDQVAPISLQPSKKKGTVVLFMSAKCPCSNSHIAVVQKLITKFSDFQFVAVHSNADETKEESQIYFKKTQLNIPIIQDDKAKLADTFKAFKTPHAFVVSAKGDVLYQGGITNSSNGVTAEENYLQQALSQISDGKAVTLASGRTLGCVILRNE